MPDREKVIKGLIEVEKFISNGKITICEPKAWSGSIHMIEAAIDLLKEQEPVAPVLVGRMWECGKCHAPVGIFMDDRRDQFCRTCGRRVKWDA